MNSQKIFNAVIFDVDETLTGDISWFKITESLGADAQHHARIYDRLRNGECDLHTAEEELLSLWRATGNATLSFMTTMFRSWHTRDGAKEIVDYLQSKYAVCLISGAVDLHVQVVAEELGVSAWYATTSLMWDTSGNLIGMEYHMDQPAQKWEHFVEYAQKHNLHARNCVAIGDGASDAILFERLGGYIVVHSSKEYEFEGILLGRVAHLSEIRSLL
jgi:HAD superfamily phosphoserine phosphatase-like hydrolase